MDIEPIRQYCLSLPETTEDMAFGEEYLLFRVKNKIFACLGLERKDYFTVKCDANMAVLLRERYADIAPAWHWNKRYWNELNLSGTLSEQQVTALIDHSYAQVVAKLPARVRRESPAIAAVDGSLQFMID